MGGGATLSGLSGQSILVTGGTGSFGRALIARLLAAHDARRVIILSRDELKQSELAEEFALDPRLRYFLGDVRDHNRLLRALAGVDLVVHAASLKQVPLLEYNPFEAVRTNIDGAQNVIDAAIERGVRRVVAISTDKACAPANLYGATKLVAEKLFVDGNAYSGGDGTRFSVVRYGNFVGSRGSIVPVLMRHRDSGVLPITDERMTRFWITLERAVDFVLQRIQDMRGGEIFVPKLPSVRILNVAHAVAPEADIMFTGIRPGEKLREDLLSPDEARSTVDAGEFFVVRPTADWWPPEAWSDLPSVDENLQYRSDLNDRWLSVDEIRDTVFKASAPGLVS